VEELNATAGLGPLRKSVPSRRIHGEETAASRTSYQLSFPRCSSQSRGQKRTSRSLLPARVNALRERLLDHIIGLSKSIGAYTSKGIWPIGFSIDCD